MQHSASSRRLAGRLRARRRRASIATAWHHDRMRYGAHGAPLNSSRDLFQRRARRGLRHGDADRIRHRHGAHDRGASARRARLRARRRRRRQGVGDAVAGDLRACSTRPASRSPTSTRSPSAAARARSPACAPRARWRRGWRSVPASRCCRSTACSPSPKTRALPAWRQRRVWALIDARMEQIYAAEYEHVDGRWSTRTAPFLTDCEALARTLAQRAAASASPATRSRVFADRLATGERCARARLATPSALALLHLAEQAWADGAALDPALALPLYVRDNVAQTTAERAARAPKKGPRAGPLLSLGGRGAKRGGSNPVERRRLAVARCAP